MPFPDCSNYSDLGNYRGEGLECCLICDLAARGSSITSVGSGRRWGEEATTRESARRGTLSLDLRSLTSRLLRLTQAARSLSSATGSSVRDSARRRSRRGCGLIVGERGLRENYQPRGQSSSFTSDSLRPRPDYLALRKPDEGN